MNLLNLLNPIVPVASSLRISSAMTAGFEVHEHDLDNARLHLGLDAGDFMILRDFIRKTMVDIPEEFDPGSFCERHYFCAKVKSAIEEKWGDKLVQLLCLGKSSNVVHRAHAIYRLLLLDRAQVSRSHSDNVWMSCPAVVARFTDSHKGTATWAVIHAVSFAIHPAATNPNAITLISSTPRWPAHYILSSAVSSHASARPACAVTGPTPSGVMFHVTSHRSAPMSNAARCLSN